VPSQVSEPINGIVGVHDLNGTFHLFTTEGLYLDTITNDRFTHSGPRTAYDLDGEMFGGRMFLNVQDGEAYLLQGHKAVSIFRIENLTTPGIVKPIPGPAEPFTLLAAQIAPAAEWALARQGQRPLLEVAPASGGAPALDGSLGGWAQASEAEFGLDADHQVQVRVMYDLQNLYLRGHLRTAGPPRPTTFGNLARCFTHEAQTDVLGFYIQGDANADPERTLPALGDVRFLLTLVSQEEGEVQPAVVGMYGIYPGGTNPITYTSPIGQAKFAEVRVLSEAQSGYALDEDGNGFTIATAIPLQAIPRLTPRAGLVTGLNFDAVFSSGLRAWWSNTGADPGASLMSDEYSEARLYPQIWGQAQFGDPSRFTLTQWSVIGPFGSAEMAKQGDSHTYVMANLAAQSYPPEEIVDLEATYEGDLTRDWRGEVKKLLWQQVEAGPGGWVRFDQAFRISGDDSRGVAFAAAWVYSPRPVTATLEVEGHGIVWGHRLWLNGEELVRELRPGAGPYGFHVVPEQEVQLGHGWNQFLVRGDSWAHTWRFEERGGWGFRLILSGREEEVWGLKSRPTPPEAETD